MDKIRLFYGQICKKIKKIKTFKTIFNGFLEIFCRKLILFYIIFQKLTMYLLKRNTCSETLGPLKHILKLIKLKHI